MKKEIKLSENFVNNIMSNKNTKSHNKLEQILKLKCKNKILKTLKTINK